jgi:carbon monoxide dehydrogenase subunit G
LVDALVAAPERAPDRAVGCDAMVARGTVGARDGREPSQPWAGQPPAGPGAKHGCGHDADDAAGQDDETMQLEVSQHVAADPAAVWRVLTAWERQPEWMLDAKSVAVLTPAREGVGVVIRCPTNLLGLTVQDVMRVTGWREERRLEVEHLGDVITGTGVFLLEPAGDGTRVDWVETIDPPLGRLGEWGASTLVLPVLRRIFGRSLANLAGLVEAEADA